MRQECADAAKLMGARNLKVVAEFYGKTTRWLRDMYSKNPRAFKALVIGYLAVESIPYQPREADELTNLAIRLQVALAREGRRFGEFTARDSEIIRKHRG